MRGDRGIAIIVVLIVLMALVLIASPFALSMILQERTSTAFRAGRAAETGALGARNFAATWLMPGLHSQERRFPRAPFDTPFVDTPGEFEPLIRDVRLSKPLQVQDPAGTIWGITLQDEQGKIHLDTYGITTILDRLRSAVDLRATDLRDYVTLHSGRPSRWNQPMRMRGVVTSGGVAVTAQAPCCRKNESLVIVDDLSHFGGRVRLTRPGLPEQVRSVISLAGGGFASHDRETHEAFNPAYIGGIVEVEQPHPLNINTASLPVLVAAISGVELTDDPTPPVSAATALKVAEAIRKSPVTSQAELVLRVDALNLSNHDRHAILMNAIDPYSTMIQGGSVPFCFTSENSVTVQARSSVNDPSGVPRSVEGFREVVRVGLADPDERRWECQEDFDRFLIHGSTWSPNVYGFPFGRRMVTVPVDPVLSSDRTLRRRQSPGREWWLQLTPAEDHRGNAQYFMRREHYPAFPEGMDLKGTSVTWPWVDVFSPMPDQAASALQQMPDVAAGGTEFWVRLNRPGPVDLFSIRESDLENRISLRYEPGTLIYTVTDGTLGDPTDPCDKGYAEIRHPIEVQRDTWYHIGAYWKGTRYAHLALLVDGFSSPQAQFNHVDEAGRTMITELPAAITDTDDAFVVADPSFIPNGTPIQIGQEVILYNAFQDPVTQQWKHVRGARGTAAATHIAQAKVQIFGYSSKVRSVTYDTGIQSIALSYDRITTGGAAILHQFGDNPQADVEGDQTDPNTGQRYIDDVQSTIRVTVPPDPQNPNPDLSQFPQQGYILIESEVIYYDNRTLSPPQFLNCQRGQHGTMAARHNSGASVSLWCIPVDGYGSAASDDIYLSPTILQVGSEWFGPVQKDPTRPNFWISFVDNGTPLPLFRGGYGTSRAVHAVAESVLPTWTAREADLNIPRRNCGGGDPVTLIHSDNGKQLMRISHATGLPASSVGGIDSLQLVAFTGNVQRVHVADDLHVRVLKFPSGELLSMSWLLRDNPSFEIGTLDGTIDEVKFFASPKGNFLLNQSLPAGGSLTADVNAGGSLNARGGAIKVGDEIVGYTETNGTLLLGTKRGWLNTPSQVHDGGDYVFNLSFLPVSTLRGSLSTTESNVRMHQPLSGDGSYTNGYVLIDREVFLFEGLRGNTTLWMPRSFDGSMGLFRGRFGTRAAGHAQDALIYGIPWRYYDTYMPQQFDNRMAYGQVSAVLPDAMIRRVRWESAVVPPDDLVRLHVLTRVDGRGEFYDAPAVTKDVQLWDFIDGTADNRIDRTAHINGGVDLRFITEYRQGAYWPNHAWKRTPKLYQAWVEYEQPTRVLYHEDR